MSTRNNDLLQDSSNNNSNINNMISNSSICKVILNYLKINNMKSSYKALIQENNFIDSEIKADIIHSFQNNKENFLDGRWEIILKEIQMLPLNEDCLYALVKQILSELVNERSTDLAYSFLNNYCFKIFSKNNFKKLSDLIATHNFKTNNHKDKSILKQERQKIYDDILKNIEKQLSIDNHNNNLNNQNNIIEPDNMESKITEFISQKCNNDLVNIIFKAYLNNKKNISSAVTNNSINETNNTTNNISLKHKSSIHDMQLIASEIIDLNKLNNHNIKLSNLKENVKEKANTSDSVTNLNLDLKENNYDEVYDETIIKFDEKISSIAISTTKESIKTAFGTNKGSIFIKDSESKELVRFDGNNKDKNSNYNNIITSLSFSADSKILVSGTSYSSILIFKSSNMKLLKKYNNIHDDRSINSILISPENSFIISGGNNGKIVLSAIKTGNILKELSLNNFGFSDLSSLFVNDLCFCGNYLVAGFGNGDVVVYNQNFTERFIFKFSNNKVFKQDKEEAKCGNYNDDDLTYNKTGNKNNNHNKIKKANDEFNETSYGNSFIHDSGVNSIIPITSSDIKNIRNFYSIINSNNKNIKENENNAISFDYESKYSNSFIISYKTNFAVIIKINEDEKEMSNDSNAQINNRNYTIIDYYYFNREDKISSLTFVSTNASLVVSCSLKNNISLYDLKSKLIIKEFALYNLKIAYNSIFNKEINDVILLKSYFKRQYNDDEDENKEQGISVLDSTGEVTFISIN